MTPHPDELDALSALAVWVVQDIIAFVSVGAFVLMIAVLAGG